MGSMAKTGVRQNGGQDLHVGLAGMLVTSYPFQKSHYIFFHVYSYCGVERLKFLFALEAWGTTQQTYMSLRIERQFFKVKNA